MCVHLHMEVTLRCRFAGHQAAASQLCLPPSSFLLQGDNCSFVRQSLEMRQRVWMNLVAEGKEQWAATAGCRSEETHIRRHRLQWPWAVPGKCPLTQIHLQAPLSQLRAQGISINAHPLPAPAPATASPSDRAAVSPVPLSPDSPPRSPPFFQMPWVSTRGSQLSSGTHTLSGWVNSSLGVLICSSRDKVRSKQQLTALPEGQPLAEARPGLPGIWNTWTGDRVCRPDIGTGEGRNGASLDSPGRLQGGGGHMEGLRDL